MSVRKYTKKPVTIEAMLLDGNAEQVLDWILINGQPSGDSGVKWQLDDNGPIFIRTLEGEMRADQGDYIIRGIQGEFYPCKPEIFLASYDLAE